MPNTYTRVAVKQSSMSLTSTRFLEFLKMTEANMDNFESILFDHVQSMNNDNSTMQKHKRHCEWLKLKRAQLTVFHTVKDEDFCIKEAVCVLNSINYIIDLCMADFVDCCLIVRDTRTSTLSQSRNVPSNRLKVQPIH